MTHKLFQMALELRSFATWRAGGPNLSNRTLAAISHNDPSREKQRQLRSLFSRDVLRSVRQGRVRRPTSARLRYRPWAGLATKGYEKGPSRRAWARLAKFARLARNGISRAAGVGMHKEISNPVCPNRLPEVKHPPRRPLSCRCDALRRFKRKASHAGRQERQMVRQAGRLGRRSDARGEGIPHRLLEFFGIWRYQGWWQQAEKMVSSGGNARCRSGSSGISRSNRCSSSGLLCQVVNMCARAELSPLGSTWRQGGIEKRKGSNPQEHDPEATRPKIQLGFAHREEGIQKQRS